MSDIRARQVITLAGVNSLHAQATGGYAMIRGSSTHEFVKLLLKQLGVTFEDCPFDGNHEGVLWCGNCQVGTGVWNRGGEAQGYKSVVPAKKKEPIQWRIHVRYMPQKTGILEPVPVILDLVRPFETFEQALAWAHAEYPTQTKCDIEQVISE